MRIDEWRTYLISVILGTISSNHLCFVNIVIIILDIYKKSASNFRSSLVCLMKFLLLGVNQFLDS